MTTQHKIYIAVGVILVILIGYFAVARAPEETVSGDAIPQGKLDIGAICESALAYMSFPDGASAEAFVAECKEGKHPEVIERYIADNNLDGAQI